VDITPVGDSRLETDAMGVTRVVFPAVKTEAPKASPPVLIPFRFSGEGAPDNPTWQLIPVWTGTSHAPDQSLATLGKPWPLFYDRFQPGNGHPPEMNALFATEPRGAVADFTVSHSETGIDAGFLYPQADTGTLAATVLALVAGSNPTPARPLTVTLSTHALNPPDWVADFIKTPGWEVIENETSPRKSSIRLRCRFVWDAEATRLVEGAVPDVEIVRTTRGPLYAEIPVLPVKKDAEIEAEKGEEKPMPER
jgi:hypothetical protein